MAQTGAGWYRDPIGTYSYRYWDGTQWTTQVNSGGTTGNDPNPLDPNLSSIPPAPGTAAPTSPSPAPVTQPSVQVTQSGGGMSLGVIVGLIAAVIAAVALVLVLMSGSDDNGTEPEDTAPTTEAPPPEEGGSDDAPAESGS